MDLDEVRVRCEQLIREFDFRDPFNLSELCAKLARRRNRPIHLLAMPAGAGNPSGLCISTAAADYVFYDGESAGVHRDHIILHEFGHLLFGHVGALSLSDVTAGLLAPSVDPRVARMMLGRHNYSDGSEQEAEMFATLVLAKVSGGAGGMPPAASAVLPDTLAELRKFFGLAAGGET
jgi:hypothetical protein